MVRFVNISCLMKISRTSKYDACFRLIQDAFKILKNISNLAGLQMVKEVKDDLNEKAHLFL